MNEWIEYLKLSLADGIKVAEQDIDLTSSPSSLQLKNDMNVPHHRPSNHRRLRLLDIQKIIINKKTPDDAEDTEETIENLNGKIEQQKLLTDNIVTERLYLLSIPLSLRSKRAFTHPSSPLMRMDRR